MFHIENHSTVHQSSYNIIGRTAFQCDTLYIDGFDIPKTNFFFGVTDSVEGSGASLLTFHDSLYMVDAIVMPKDNLKLTRGSTIPATDSQSTLRGVRCLWFVIDAGMTMLHIICMAIICHH